MARPTKQRATSMDKMMTAAVAVIILIVAALAVFAVKDKIGANLETKAVQEEATAIENGTQEATVRYLANSAGKSVEEYLADYGLTLGGDIKKTSTQQEMLDNMTIENYFKYVDANSGSEEATDVAAKLTDWDAEAAGVTKDTLWKDAEEKIAIGKYAGEDDFKSMMEYYTSMGYDVSSITQDMSIKDAMDKIEEITSKDPTLPTPTPMPETTEAPTAGSSASN